MAQGFANSTTPLNLRNSWRTPGFLVSAYDRVYGFTGDVAASAENACFPRYLTAGDNAPVRGWGDFGGYVWCNPPYDDITPWVRAAGVAAASGTGTVMIVPADAANSWFELALETVHGVDFITGTRVGFIHPQTGKVNTENMRGSVVLIWHPGVTARYWEPQTRYLSYSVIEKMERRGIPIYEHRGIQ